LYTIELPEVTTSGNGHPRTQPVPVAKVSAQDAANELNGLWDKCIEACIAIGLRIQWYKDHLPHGEFGTIFKDHPQRVAKPFRFGWDYGRVFMKIASNEALANPANWPFLPGSTRPLEILAALPAAVIEALIAAQRITPTLETRDAEILVVALGQDDSERIPPASAVAMVKTDIEQFVAARMRLLGQREQVQAVAEFLHDLGVEWWGRGARLPEYVRANPWPLAKGLRVLLQDPQQAGHQRALRVLERGLVVVRDPLGEVGQAAAMK